MANDPDEIHARIAAQIRWRTQRKGMTLRALASELGTSSSHLWAVLAGRRSPTMAWLCRVADALGCEPIALLRPLPRERSRD